MDAGARVSKSSAMDGNVSVVIIVIRVQYRLVKDVFKYIQ